MSVLHCAIQALKVTKACPTMVCLILLLRLKSNPKSTQDSIFADVKTLSRLQFVKRKLNLDNFSETNE